MDAKDVLIKLFKVAQKQQKILEKLAAKTVEANDPIWYGKLDPNDPRKYDPLYGGEAPPEEAYHKQSAAKPHGNKPMLAVKHMPTLSALPADLKQALDMSGLNLQGSKITVSGKNVSVRYNTRTTGGPTMQQNLINLLSPLGYTVTDVIGETNPDWTPNYT